MPFIMASYLTTLMWALSSGFHSQAASSPPIPNKASNARLLTRHSISSQFCYSSFTRSTLFTSAMTTYHVQHLLVNCILPLVCTSLSFDKVACSPQPSNHRVMTNQFLAHHSSAILYFKDLISLSKHQLSCLDLL